MIFDNSLVLSDYQAITASAVSTNTLDLGPIALGQSRDIGRGTKVPLRIQVVEAFNNLTSLKIDLQTDDNTSFSSPKTVWSQTVLLADLILGKIIVPEYVTRGTDERYARLNYTVTGTAPTTGKIMAGVIAEEFH